MALRGVKGGGFVTAKKLQQIGVAPNEFGGLTADEQADTLGWEVKDPLFNVQQLPMPDDPAAQAAELTKLNLVQSWTPEETIKYYTYYSKHTQDPVYHIEDANRKIWKGEPLTPSEAAKLTKLDAAIQNTPAYKGTVFRYMGFHSADALQTFLAPLQQQGILKTQGVMSTSKSEGVSKGFANFGYFKGAAGVMIKINASGKRGHDISKKSNVGSEQEILYRHNTRFKVKTISAWKGNSPRFKYYIELDEM